MTLGEEYLAAGGSVRESFSNIINQYGARDEVDDLDMGRCGGGACAMCNDDGLAWSFSQASFINKHWIEKRKAGNGYKF